MGSRGIVGGYYQYNLKLFQWKIFIAKYLTLISKRRSRDQQFNTYERHSNSFRYVIFYENVNRR